MTESKPEKQQAEPQAFFAAPETITQSLGYANCITFPGTNPQAIGSKWHLKLMIGSAPVSIALLDRNMCFLATSQRWLDDFRLESIQPGSDYYQIFPNTPDHWRKIHLRALAGKTFYAESDQFLRMDGSTQWLRWEVCPWYDTQGDIGGIVIFSEDITGRKLAEAEIRELNRFQKAVLDSISAHVCVIDCTGRILAVNLAWNEFAAWNAGSDTSELGIGANYLTACDRAADANGTAGKIAQGIREVILNTRETFSCEYPFLTTGGEELWFIACAKRCRDTDPIRVVITHTNITERKRAETEALAGKAKLEAVLSSIHDALVIAGSDGRFIDFNETFASFHKFSGKAECPKSLDELQAILEVSTTDGIPLSLDEWPVSRALRGNTASEIEYTLRRKDSGIVWLGSYSFAPIRSGGIAGAVVTSRDITARRLIESALLSSKERLNGLVHSAMDGIVSTDERQRIVLFNPAAEKVFGVKAELVLGRLLDCLIPHIFREAHREHVRTFSETGVTARRMGLLGRITGLRANGQEFPMEASISQTITPEGKLFTIILRDITEREQAAKAQKLAEERIREQRLKLEATNHHYIARQTAAAIAHELNQPLTAIATYTTVAKQLLQSDKADPDALHYALENAEKQSLRAGQVMRELLSLLYKDDSTLEAIDLKAVLVEAIGLADAANDLGKTVQVTLDIAADLQPVLANRIQIQKVLINLLNNALQALHNQTRQRPKITLRARVFPGNPTMAQITVIDTGTGFHRRDTDLLFQPFYSTKNAGLGMGLAVSRALIEAGGGKLWAEPNRSAGASFHFTLPFVK